MCVAERLHVQVNRGGGGGEEEEEEEEEEACSVHTRDGGERGAVVTCTEGTCTRAHTTYTCATGNCIACRLRGLVFVFLGSGVNALFSSRCCRCVVTQEMEGRCVSPQPTTNTEKTDCVDLFVQVTVTIIDLLGHGNGVGLFRSVFFMCGYCPSHYFFVCEFLHIVLHPKKVERKHKKPGNESRTETHHEIEWCTTITPQPPPNLQ